MIAQENTENLRGNVPTALGVTNPSEDSAGQANRPPGKVSTVVVAALPSKDFACVIVHVQKNAAQNIHGKVPMAVTNPSERSGGQTNRLPGKASRSVMLRSRGYTGWAIVQKNAVHNLHPKVSTAVYSPDEDSAGQTNCLPGKVSTAVTLRSKGY